MYTIHFWKFSKWGLQLQILDMQLYNKIILAHTNNFNYIKIQKLENKAFKTLNESRY